MYFIKKKIRQNSIKFFKYIINKQPDFSIFVYLISKLYPFNRFSAVYKLKYFSTHTNYKKLINAKIGRNYDFKDIKTSKLNYVDKQLNGLGYLEIQDCNIIAGAEFIFCKSVAFKQNYTLGSPINNFRLANFNGSIDNNEFYMLSKKIKIASKKLNKVIYLSGTYDENWYHWLIEILPKLFIIKEKIKKFDDYDIVISENIYHSSTHMQSLKLFASKNNIISINPKYFYRTKHVIFVESPSISNRARKKIFTHDMLDGNFYQQIFKVFRQYIKNKLLINNNKHDNERVYLFRNQNKRKFNQHAVIELLKKFNFKIVDLMKLKFDEQVLLFHNSKIIIGVTGAAWTNLIFCQKNTKGLLFCPNSVKGSTTFTNLASLSGMSLYQQNLKIPEDNWQSYMKSDKEALVDIKLLEQNLKKIISSNDY